MDQTPPRSTEKMSASYRKTKTGEWVVMAPVTTLRVGENVTVTKRDGSTKVERIERVGRPFTVDGVEMAYGYIVREHQTYGAAMTRRSQPRSQRCDCDEGWATVIVRDGSGITGKVCRRCAADPIGVSFA